MSEKLFSKSEVHYSVGMKQSHCGKCFDNDDGYCTHFKRDKNLRLSAAGECEVVAGYISPNYWCDKFKKAVK